MLFRTFLVCIALLAGSCSAGELSSDKTLVTRFERNAHLWNVLPVQKDLDYSDAEAMAGFARRPVLRDLMDRMRVRSIRTWPDPQRPIVLFEIDALDAPGGHSSKGIAWLRYSPDRLHDSLDVEPADYEPGQPIYREIEWPFYIYYQRTADRPTLASR